MSITTSRKTIATMALAALLTLVSISSDAARSVRSDASDSAFDTLGGFWGSDQQVFAPGGSVPADTVPLASYSTFKLNFGNGAKAYRICMSASGFASFTTALSCSPAAFALPPSGNYIAIFASSDLENGFMQVTRGMVDFKAPYQFSKAVPAVRIWWSGVDAISDPDHNPFSFQIVLIDRSENNSPGDFDIEMNYGVSPGDTTFGVGSRSLKLGSNFKAPVQGPFVNDGAPLVYCFRSGKLRAGCSQP